MIPNLGHQLAPGEILQLLTFSGRRAGERWLLSCILAAILQIPLAAQATSTPIAPPDPDAPNAPVVEISNGIVQAKVYLPDAERGYYRATRFDWSGVVADLQANGHSYFGRWFEKYDPKIHDSISGPVQEFVTGLGYEAAKPGGTFVKIGVGVLRKPQDPAARGFATLEIVDSGKWTTTVHKDSVEFVQEVQDPASGYGYRYRKLVSLPPGKVQMVLDQRIESTGPNPIDIEMYDHNFFVIDRQPSGPDFEIRYPFALTASGLRGPAEVSGNQVKLLQVLNGTVRTNLKGFGNTPADYNIHVENRKTGAGVAVTSDQPLSNAVFWSAPKVVSPEAYMHIHADRGHPMEWKIFYDFYSAQKAN